MPKRESTRAHWSAFWAGHQDIDQVYSNEGRIPAELGRVRSLANAKVLEVGAGSGRDSLLLAREGARPVTLDYTLEALRIIQRLARREGVPIDLVCADCTRMPFRPGTFDVVFHQGLMEHFRDPGPLLAENHRVLKPGGHALIDVPQRYHLYTVAKHILIALGRWFAGWETEYSIRELEGLVERHGFEVRHRYGEWMVPGLFYRSVRTGLRRFGILLPLYPPGVPGIAQGAAAFRRWFRPRRAALYTFLVIGVIGEKR
jgi:SAM-dependent methyltransferase